MSGVVIWAFWYVRVNIGVLLAVMLFCGKSGGATAVQEMESSSVIYNHVPHVTPVISVTVMINYHTTFKLPQ